MKVELLVSNQTQLGEGPVWDHRSNTLYWVDIEKGNLQAYDYYAGKNTIYQMGEFVGAAVPTEQGNLIVALKNRIVLFDRVTGQTDTLYTPEPDRPNVRFNDGKCDPAGRFWIGSTHIDHRDPIGTLYCVDATSCSAKLSNLLISNGMAWSLDHSNLYFIDSPTRKVQEFFFDLKTAEIRYSRDALIFDPTQGTPDGMCIDNEGMLWIAFYGAGRVARFNPRSGQYLEEIKVPAKNTTSCCFGGPDLDILFITTAQRDDPKGGGLYCCRPGKTGPYANFYNQT